MLEPAQSEPVPDEPQAKPAATATEPPSVTAVQTVAPEPPPEAPLGPVVAAADAPAAPASAPITPAAAPLSPPPASFNPPPAAGPASASGASPVGAGVSAPAPAAPAPAARPSRDWTGLMSMSVLSAILGAVLALLALAGLNQGTLLLTRV